MRVNMHHFGKGTPAGVGRRLDLLMRVTGMRNAQLARVLNFDPSYISRVRAGKRGLPREHPFIMPASDFFARNVREENQRVALAHELGMTGGWPEDRGEAARLIARWLEGVGNDGDRDAADAEAAGGGDAAGETPPMVGQRCEAWLFFGDAGRREAALAFLGAIAETGEPCELLLQSDEGTAWMYEDAAFIGAWSGVMAELVAIGCTLTVVHTVSRDGNEMWEGVREWLPLYLSGAIRPYYYPRLRDGVRTRSLFVARGRCALVSSSVQGMDGDELCAMFDDEDAVAALSREFDAYLRLCVPLAVFEQLPSRADLDGLLEGFRGVDGVVAAELHGAVVCAIAGRAAIVALPGEPPVAYRIGEPRLVDALVGYVDSLPGKATTPAQVDALLGGFVGRDVAS